MHFHFGILEMHLKNAFKTEKKIMDFENAFP
jgi:hypothetical protein